MAVAKVPREPVRKDKRIEDRVKVLVHEHGFMPKKSTPAAAGYDLFNPKTMEIPPKTYIKVDMCVSLVMPPNIRAEVHGRSCLQGKKLKIDYGLIDPDYMIRIFIGLTNLHPSKHLIIKKGDSLAQLVYTKIPNVSQKQVRNIETQTRLTKTPKPTIEYKLKDDNQTKFGSCRSPTVKELGRDLSLMQLDDELTRVIEHANDKPDWETYGRLTYVEADLEDITTVDFDKLLPSPPEQQ